MAQRARTIWIGAAVLLAGIVLAACSARPLPGPAPTAAPTSGPLPGPTGLPNPTTAPQATLAIPYLLEWQGSPHANASAPAFTYWNQANPPQIPTQCAACHSTPGFEELAGAVGTNPGKVSHPVLVGTVIACAACHTPAAQAMKTVAFPSGAKVSAAGMDGACIACHEGTASVVQVDSAVQQASAAGEDSVSSGLHFVDIHSGPAAVARYGSLAKGGYEYPGKAYDPFFVHAPGSSSCTDCHDAHTGQISVETCRTCHFFVRQYSDLKDIRMLSSKTDFDGGGDQTNGIYYEVQGMQRLLYQAIQEYASQVSGKPIVYDGSTPPFFFVDSNGNGQVDPGEAAAANQYNAWTPRLVKAAYNYQVVTADLGIYTHGAKYAIELLYDSTADLNSRLAKPVDLTNAHRTSPPHFNASAAAFRYWDSTGEVPAACAKCHSAEGLPTFMKDHTNVSAHPADGLACSTCHPDVTRFNRFPIQQVKFPNGAMGTFGRMDDNTCLECHEGRVSTADVAAAVRGLDPNKPADQLAAFTLHNAAAAAVSFGHQAQGGYEYPGRSYAGRFLHVDGYISCLDCHDTHGLNAEVDACVSCHNSATPAEYRGGPNVPNNVDYDGNGNATEGISVEVANEEAALYAALQAYAQKTLKAPLVYAPGAYPYFYKDSNGNGKADPQEIDPKNGYTSWSPRLLEAAYNYQFAVSDRGAYVHNARYILQLLYDSLQDLGADVSKMKRPS